MSTASTTEFRGPSRPAARQLPQDEPRPLAVEVPCEAPLVDPVSGENLDIPLVGLMDLVLPEGAGPIITDFKTASKSSGPLEITHEVQLSCYSYFVPESLADARSRPGNP
jgi:hypothetical protein